MLYHIPTSGLSTLFTIDLACTSMYCVATCSSVQSSTDSICSRVFSLLSNWLFVLNCAPRPFLYSSASSCSDAMLPWFFLLFKILLENMDYFQFCNFQFSIC